jgi:hypothetical protein
VNTEDKALLGEMLARIGDKRTADELMQDIRESTIEERRAWHRDVRAMLAAFNLVMDAIEDVPVEP